MKIKKWYQRMLGVWIVVMLVSISVGSAYLTPVYANPVNEDQTDAKQEIKDKQKDQEKAILGGLLLVGLVSAMSNHGSDNKNHNSTDKSGDYIESEKPKDTGSSSKSAMSAEEQQLVNLINNERVNQGLPALKGNNAVANVARGHSQDMMTNNYFDHYDLKGGSPFTRLSKAGIAYRSAGENIAINGSVPSAHTAFMNSAGHRANVLSGDYTQVGVGIVHSGARIWVTENFIG